jgi:hypothetical protein
VPYLNFVTDPKNAASGLANRFDVTVTDNKHYHLNDLRLDLTAEDLGLNLPATARPPSPLATRLPLHPNKRSPPVADLDKEEEEDDSPGLIDERDSHDEDEESEEDDEENQKKENGVGGAESVVKEQQKESKKGTGGEETESDKEVKRKEGGVTKETNREGGHEGDLGREKPWRREA